MGKLHDVENTRSSQTGPVKLFVQQVMMHPESQELADQEDKQFIHFVQEVKGNGQIESLDHGIEEEWHVDSVQQFAQIYLKSCTKDPKSIPCFTSTTHHFQLQETPQDRTFSTDCASVPVRASRTSTRASRTGGATSSKCSSSSRLSSPTSSSSASPISPEGAAAPAHHPIRHRPRPHRFRSLYSHPHHRCIPDSEAAHSTPRPPTVADQDPGPRYQEKGSRLQMWRVPTESQSGRVWEGPRWWRTMIQHRRHCQSQRRRGWRAPTGLQFRPGGARSRSRRRLHWRERAPSPLNSSPLMMRSLLFSALWDGNGSFLRCSYNEREEKWRFFNPKGKRRSPQSAWAARLNYVARENCQWLSDAYFFVSLFLSSFWLLQIPVFEILKNRNRKFGLWLCFFQVGPARLSVSKCIDVSIPVWLIWLTKIIDHNMIDINTTSRKLKIRFICSNLFELTNLIVLRQITRVL